MTKENAMIDVLLTYEKGLDKHYGLIELAEQSGVFKKVSTRYEMPDGTKVFGKSIMNEPEKYFTKDVLEKIDEQAKNDSSTNKRYVYVQRDGDDFSSIKIVEGKYKDVIYKYLVQFANAEQPDGNLPLQFQ